MFIVNKEQNADDQGNDDRLDNDILELDNDDISDNDILDSDILELSNDDILEVDNNGILEIENDDILEFDIGKDHHDILEVTNSDGVLGNDDILETPIETLKVIVKNKKRKGPKCRAILKSGESCVNAVHDRYDNLYCGVHARSKGYVTIEESKRRVQLNTQPLACGVTFNDDGTVQLDVVTLESMKIYAHQFQTATRVVNYLLNGEEHILVAAEPQLGKTGTIQTICWMGTRLHRNVNPIVILPMNDNDLARQISKDYSGLIPSTNIINAQNLRDHLYLSKILEKDKINWIIIDESHLGTTLINGHNTLKRELSTISVNLNLSLVPTNVRLISISATPMAEVASIGKLDGIVKSDYNPEEISETNIVKAKVLVTMAKPDHYFGVREMNSRGQILQTGCLRDQKWCQQLLDALDQKMSGYIICRVTQQSGAVLRANIIDRLKEPDQYRIVDCHHKKEKTVDFNALISHPPDRLVFLFIYGRLRASKRLENKEYILAVHDYNKSCDATVQGLLGRLCGYSEHNIRAFLNYGLLVPYFNWLNQAFNPNAVPDKSRNVVGGVTYQQLKRQAKGYIPVKPVVIGLEDDDLAYYQALYAEFKANKSGTYYQIADRVVSKFINISNVNGTHVALVNGGSDQLHIDGRDYWVRGGNAMMFIASENSEKTVKLFQSRYQSYLKGDPVFPFTVADTKQDNLYFLYINLLDTERLKPCLFLGLVQHEKERTDVISEKVKVKPASLYYLPEASQS